MVMINIGGKFSDVEVDVILNYDLINYIHETHDTIGDASIPYGTKKVTCIEVDVSPNDIIYVYHEIETAEGMVKVDLLPYIKENNPLFHHVIMTVEQTIADDYDN